MKRLFALILAFALLATLCACGGKKAGGRGKYPTCGRGRD